MTDLRAQCWLNAQDCLNEADRIAKKLKFTQNTTMAEVPAALGLYLQRAQIFATLACAPYDTMVAVTKQAEAKEELKIRLNRTVDEHRAEREREEATTRNFAGKIVHVVSTPENPSEETP